MINILPLTSFSSMAHCRANIQSLSNISPFRTDDSDLNSPSSIREAAKLAADRRNATTWIKAAVASDLVPLSACRTKNVSPKAKNEVKSRSKPRQVTKLKGTCTIKKQRNIGDFYYAGLAAEKENLPDWVKGSTLIAAGNLAHFLQEECRTLFIAYIENYLDAWGNECLSKVPDSEVAESMC